MLSSCSSESETTAVLDLLPVGAMIVDAELRILKWNRTLAEWTGVTAEEAMGDRLTRLFANLADSLYQKRLGEMFLRGLPVVFSASLHRHFLPIRPRHGTSVGMMVQQTEARLLPSRRDRALICIQDVSLQYFHITQLKQERAELVATQEQMQKAFYRLEVSNDVLEKTEQTLRQSRETTDNIIASMLEMLVVIEPDGTISRVNRAACEVLGYDEEELVGQHVGLLFGGPAQSVGPKSWADVDCPMQRKFIGSLFGERQAKHLEGWCQKKDGTRIDVAFSGAVLQGADDLIQGAVCVLQDVSERNRIQRELVRAQKLESLGQLAAGIAHEINTPMQCVASNVEYLEEIFARLLDTVDACSTMLESPPEEWASQAEAVLQRMKQHRIVAARDEAPHAVRDASQAVRRVIEIVRAMKSMSHPGTREFVPTNVNRLIRDAVTITTNRWKAVGDVRLELDEDLPEPNALQAELIQVVLNLVVNAGDALVEKYGDSDRRGTICIRTIANEENVVIEVEDDGPGIPDDIRDRVFEPFFTTKEVGRGTGQGLAFCYQVVTRHHGTMDVFSNEGQGTTFVVTLPLDPDAAPDSRVCRLQQQADGYVS